MKKHIRLEVYELERRQGESHWSVIVHTSVPYERQVQIGCTGEAQARTLAALLEQCRNICTSALTSADAEKMRNAPSLGKDF